MEQLTIPVVVAMEWWITNCHSPPQLSVSRQFLWFAAPHWHASQHLEIEHNQWWNVKCLCWAPEDQCPVSRHCSTPTVCQVISLNCTLYQNIITNYTTYYCFFTPPQILCHTKIKQKIMVYLLKWKMKFL